MEEIIIKIEEQRGNTVIEKNYLLEVKEQDVTLGQEKVKP